MEGRFQITVPDSTRFMLILTHASHEVEFVQLVWPFPAIVLHIEGKWSLRIDNVSEIKTRLSGLGELAIPPRLHSTSDRES